MLDAKLCLIFLFLGGEGALKCVYYISNVTGLHSWESLEKENNCLQQIKKFGPVLAITKT